MRKPEVPLDPERVLATAADGLDRDRVDPSSLPSSDQLAGAFSQYEVLDCIGRGGMGIVYRARQRELDRRVALKILPKELAADPGFEERFAREARALARLDHPHILRVYDCGRSDGWFYLTTEFVDGSNLRAVMRDGILSRAETLHVVGQICDALHFAHERGVVHRDIKPENILIDLDGNVKVADFGLAKLHDHEHDSLQLTGTRQALGTPHYMAPEQLVGDDVDHRADLYSLAVVVYEMLTGQLPVGRFPEPSKSGAQTMELDDAVMRNLEREPGRRHPTASAFKTALGQPTSSAPRSPSVDRTDPRAQSRNPAFIAAGLTALFFVMYMTAGVEDAAWYVGVVAAFLGFASLSRARALGASSLEVHVGALAAWTCIIWLPAAFVISTVALSSGMERGDAKVLTLWGGLLVALPIAFGIGVRADRDVQRRTQERAET